MTYRASLPSAGIRTPRGGFSLVETLVAVLVLEVGLLACAGMILSAQRTLARARLLQRAVMETSRSADSLTELGWSVKGSRAFPGGKVEWIPEEDGRNGVRIFSVGIESGDTLIRMRAWSLAQDAEKGPPRGPPAAEEDE
jgi:Tfp pilus assembly protein PilV